MAPNDQPDVTHRKVHGEIDSANTALIVCRVGTGGFSRSVPGIRRLAPDGSASHAESWHDGISAEDLYEISRAWWVMSPANAQRVDVAGQELFHSNTIAGLLRNFPIPCAPLLDLLGGTRYDGVRRVDVWRERRHLDIVIDPVGASPKVVIEIKLYSVPYPAQLSQYNAYPLPWSPDHGEGGAQAPSLDDQTGRRLRRQGWVGHLRFDGPAPTTGSCQEGG